jgi:hypothetical protein
MEYVSTQVAYVFHSTYVYRYVAKHPVSCGEMGDGDDNGCLEIGNLYLLQPAEKMAGHYL